MLRSTNNKIKAPQKKWVPLSSGINSAEKQKGKKEGGWGGIFALLRLRLERFRFSLIKRNILQHDVPAKKKKLLAKKLKK